MHGATVPAPSTTERSPCPRMQSRASAASSSRHRHAFGAAGWTVRGTSRSPGAGTAPPTLKPARAWPRRSGAPMRLPYPAAGLPPRAPRWHRPHHCPGGGRCRRAPHRAEHRRTPATRPDRRHLRRHGSGGPIWSPALCPSCAGAHRLHGQPACPVELPGIQAGTLAYPATEATRIAWMSHRTLAQAMVAATTADVAGRFAIGGPAGAVGDRHDRHTVRADEPPAWPMRPSRWTVFAAGLTRPTAPPQATASPRFTPSGTHPASNADGHRGPGAAGLTGESFADFVARNPFAAAA